MPKDDPRAPFREYPDYPHWEAPKGRGPHDPPPPDLCKVHKAAWLTWRDHYRRYRTDNPKEWPGGAHIMDSRTSHTTRRRSWIEKDAGQMELIETICRSGKSPECDRTPTPAPAARLVTVKTILDSGEES